MTRRSTSFSDTLYLTSTPQSSPTTSKKAFLFGLSPLSSLLLPTLTPLPRSSHHLEALDKLQLPRLEVINLHLAEQEAKAATVTAIEEKTVHKPKRKRGGARARRAREKAMAPVVAGAA